MEAIIPKINHLNQWYTTLNLFIYKLHGGDYINQVIDDQKDSQESACSGTEREWETRLTEERIYEEVTNVVSPSFTMQSNVAYATVGHT